MIRKATKTDLSRIAEIFIFNNRVNYLPIFNDEGYSFGELQVIGLADNYFGRDEILSNLYVTENEKGIICGFIEMKGEELYKLYVEVFFQGRGYGSEILRYAVNELGAKKLWVLEKNDRARAFYEKHGLVYSGKEALEEGTSEKLLEMRILNGIKQV